MNQMEQRHYSQELAEHTARQRDVVHQHQMEEGVSEGQTQKEESDKPSSQASGTNRQDNGESNVRTPPAVKGLKVIDYGKSLPESSDSDIVAQNESPRASD